MIPSDPLTGLRRKQAFLADLSRLVWLGQPFGLLLIAIDSLKAVNGFALHARGDEMLRRTAQAIVATGPDKSLAFRYGGDEFAVLLPAATTGEAVELGERICAAVAVIEVPVSDEPDPAQPTCRARLGWRAIPLKGRRTARS